MEKILIEKYSKNDCCLCAKADKVLDRVKNDYPINLVNIDILKDNNLHEKFKEYIPVIFINGKEEFVFKVSEFALRKRLDEIFGGRK